ncbi:hypothetical protein [Marinobacterium aestuariivivens]|uniref:Cell division protein ZipA n=1 Tax=Marinobacterium aestuariivivens TaxID=1698799 RepID=A0ABW1ZX44_9GAMM
MEISLREWLVIGGVVVIALIVFDGWRRVRGGRSSLRMDIDRRLKNQAEDADEPNNPELPYGGARPAGDSVTESEPRPAAKPAPSQPARRAVAQSASERIEPTFGDEPDPDARAGSVAAPQPSLSAFDPDDDVDPLFDEPAAAQVERQQPEAPPSVQSAGKKQEPEPVAARAASPEPVPGPEPVRQSVEIPQSPPRGLSRRRPPSGRTRSLMKSPTTRPSRRLPRHLRWTWKSRCRC